MGTSGLGIIKEVCQCTKLYILPMVHFCTIANVAFFHQDWPLLHTTPADKRQVQNAISHFLGSIHIFFCINILYLLNQGWLLPHLPFSL